MLSITQLEALTEVLLDFASLADLEGCCWMGSGSKVGGVLDLWIGAIEASLVKSSAHKNGKSETLPRKVNEDSYFES
jgi:hypothetical protein